MSCHDSNIAKCEGAALRGEFGPVRGNSFPHWHALSGALSTHGRGACAGLFGDPSRRPHAAAPAMMHTRFSVIV